MGKSFTTQALVEQLLAQRRTVAVTASTGTAALNIDGMTVHRWARGAGRCCCWHAAALGDWVERARWVQCAEQEP